jgi:mono/diheme cytochrome c family protein
MLMKRICIKSFIIVPLFVVLSACYSLAEDITPPPGYEYQPPPQSVEPTEVMYYPLMPPNPAVGALIFAEDCAPCHGEYGIGNGPQASQLPNPVAPIGDPQLARQSRPSEWFRTITEGNIEKYMPPFTSLTDRQRWDVLAYVYTLSTEPASIALGEELYQENCTVCHGDEGMGDGVEALSLDQAATDFTNQSFMAERSKADLFDGLTHPGLNDFPDYQNQFTVEDRWSLVDYLRSITFSGSGEIIAAEESGTQNEDPVEAELTLSELEADEISLGKISGQVVNISNTELPEDLEVTLHGYDQFQEVITKTVGVQQGGIFDFSEVDIPLGRAFIVTVDYKGGTYTSDIAVVDEGTEEMFLPISIYETTADKSGLSIDRLHVLFEFVTPDVLRVAYLYIISNISDRVVTVTEEGSPVLSYTLPEGAINLQFQEGILGQDFIQTDKGFGDIRAIPPGEGRHQVLFSFDLPYDRDVRISQPLEIPVHAVVVLAPDVGVKISSDHLVSEGVRDVQGTPYMFFSSGDLPAGGELSINLAGRARLSGSGIAMSASMTNTAVGLGALGVAVLVAGGWLYRRTNNIGVEEDVIEVDDLEETQLLQLGEEMDVESLMDAVIALDDHYKSGNLPENAYLQRRALLKEQLREELKREKEGP